MLGSTRHNAVAVAAVALASLAAAGDASACCPNDGQGKPLAASTGLGAASPAAADVSADSSWHVYQFSRDGIDYIQVNDQNGVVRAAAGRVGDTAWVMPIGSDADRVVISATPTGNIIHQSSSFIVRIVRGTDGDSWVITPVTTAPAP